LGGSIIIKATSILLVWWWLENHVVRATWSKMVAFPLATRKNQGNTGLQNAAGKRSQTRAALPKGKQIF
jgi:hypothetical protein